MEDTGRVTITTTTTGPRIRYQERDVTIMITGIIHLLIIHGVPGDKDKVAVTMINPRQEIEEE